MLFDGYLIILVLFEFKSDPIYLVDTYVYVVNTYVHMYVYRPAITGTSYT